MKALVQRDVMKVISSFVSAHRSRNEPSNVRDGDCRDGDKLICNTYYQPNFLFVHDIKYMVFITNFIFITKEILFSFQSDHL